MKLLITGVAGFIGSNFMDYIISNANVSLIIGLDLLIYPNSYSNLSNTIENSKFKFIKGDIRNTELVEYIFEKYDPDYVINFAAESHVDSSIKNPLIFFESNIMGLANLLEVSKNYWYHKGKWVENKRFLQISTDEVYGSLGSEGLFTENTPINPHSPYSSSKASGDLITKAYHDTFGMPILITRCSNNYGPKQFLEKLIPVIITKALKHEKIPIYGDGLQIRDWLYVEDHCKAIFQVLIKGKIGEVYNVGGSNEIKNIDIVKYIIKILNDITNDDLINENLITHVEDRLGHDRRYGIDSSKLQNELGWKPAMNFSEGIDKTIRWYLSKYQKT